ncbi:MAG: Methyltransferase type 11 [Frankiales bacterium]|nr:Methyltransferase type 11 [Frankiales bacterium]
MFDETWWDDRYRTAPALWSGRPNRQLVAEVAELPPGTALDAGAGEGADALWLAGRGWQVTAVDLSAVALERAAAQADREGGDVAGRLRWVHADLATWTPPVGAFDLVSAQFLHMPTHLREPLYDRLADAVAPGGTLLLVAHDPSDLHQGPGGDRDPDWFVTAGQLAAALDPAAWQVLVAESRPRTATYHDGHEIRVSDAVLRARRRP